MGALKCTIFSTPKARGEFVGTIERSNRDAFYLKEDSNIAAGDGLCFLNSFGKLEGFRVNKVVNSAIFQVALYASLEGLKFSEISI